MSRAANRQPSGESTIAPAARLSRRAQPEGGAMPTLPTRQFGRTGMTVTRLGHGAMEFRGPRIWGGREVTDEQAKTILNAVLDAGIDFVDTSNDYGRSEAYIGEYISNRRDQYVLATKCGCSMVPCGRSRRDAPRLDPRPPPLERRRQSREDADRPRRPPPASQRECRASRGGEADRRAPRDPGGRQDPLHRRVDDVSHTSRRSSAGASSTASRSRTPRSSGATSA